MAALTDIELLAQCADFSLHQIHDVEKKVMEELETSGATRLVMALRRCRLQRAVVTVGMFSIFESLLQQRMNWVDTFAELRKYLLNHKEVSLYHRFDNYFKAINALKHGLGASHTNLLNRPNLGFKVRSGGDFFSEGDVSEVGILIDVDDLFMREAANLVRDVAALISIKEGVQLWSMN